MLPAFLTCIGEIDRLCRSGCVCRHLVRILCKLPRCCLIPQLLVVNTVERQVNITGYTHTHTYTTTQINTISDIASLTLIIPPFFFHHKIGLPAYYDLVFDPVYPGPYTVSTYLHTYRLCGHRTWYNLPTVPIYLGPEPYPSLIRLALISVSCLLTFGGTTRLGERDGKLVSL